MHYVAIGASAEIMNSVRTSSHQFTDLGTNSRISEHRHQDALLAFPVVFLGFAQDSLSASVV